MILDVGPTQSDHIVQKWQRMSVKLGVVRLSIWMLGNP